MGLHPGQKAICGAGRKKGTPNKNQDELRKVYDQAAYAGWNPIQMMAEIGYTGLIPLFDPETQLPYDPPQYAKVETKTRCLMLKESSEYGFAKRKALEVSNSDDNPVAGGLMINFVKAKPIIEVSFNGEDVVPENLKYNGSVTDAQIVEAEPCSVPPESE